MATLAFAPRAAGKTVQLADPAPLTTHEIFETIARALAGRGSRITAPAPLVRTSLNLPISESLSGLPRVGVPYFFLDQTYDTATAESLLDTRGVRCPPFTSYVDALVDFVARHPKL